MKFFGEAETEAMSDIRARRITSRSRSAIPGNMRARHDLKSGKEVRINHVPTRQNINSGEEVTTNHHFEHYLHSLRDGEHPSVIKVKFIGDDVTEAVNDIGVLNKNSRSRTAVPYLSK